MKLYKSAKDVKEALLNGEEVVINDWSANINDHDEIEIWDPKGAGVAASLMVLDKAVDDFMKMAQMPDKTPKPKEYPATEDPKKVLGPDSSEDKPWVDPKINTQPPVQNNGADETLGADTSQDSPWADPSVNDRPHPEADQGLEMPDTDLGSDTSQNPVEWEDKLTGPEEFRMAQGLPWAKDVKKTPSSEDLGEIFSPEDTGLDWAGEEKMTPGSEDLGEVFSPGSAGEELIDPVADNSSYANLLYAVSSGLLDYAYAGELLQKMVSSNEPVPVQLVQTVLDQVKGDLSADPTLQDAYSNLNDALQSWEEGVSFSGEDLQASKNAIVDTFDQPEDHDFLGEYQKLVQASPSEQILRDIADPDKWAANRELEKLSEALDKKKKHHPGKGKGQVGEEGSDGAGLGTGDGGGAAASCGKDAARIKENWGDYTRDLEAETVEDLYHAVRALGQDDDYDWGKYRGVGPNDPAMAPAEVVEDQNLMAEPVPTSPVTNPVEASIKEAVDQGAKDYWTKYYGEYGEKLVTDDSGRPNRKDPHDVEVQEQPKPQNQQKVKEAQMVPGGMPQAPSPAIPEGQGAADAPAPAAPGAPPPQALPAGPDKAPGAGDEGLKALGWTPEDIQMMSPQDKENVLKIQLKKPGTGAPAQPAPGAPKAPAPVAPKDPTQAPQGGPAPLPVEQKPMVPGAPAPTAAREAREKADAKKVQKAFQMLTAQVPAQSPMPPAPNNPGAQPVQAPPVDAAPMPADPAFAGEGDMADEGISSELAAFDIYRQIQEEEVSASSPNEVPVIKAQKLVQRLLSEVGMPVVEARALFGLAKDQSFTKLFASLLKREK